MAVFVACDEVESILLRGPLQDGCAPTKLPLGQLPLVPSRLILPHSFCGIANRKTLSHLLATNSPQFRRGVRDQQIVYAVWPKVCQLSGHWNGARRRYGAHHQLHLAWPTWVTVRGKKKD